MGLFFSVCVDLLTGLGVREALFDMMNVGLFVQLPSFPYPLLVTAYLSVVRDISH